MWGYPAGFASSLMVVGWYDRGRRGRVQVLSREIVCPTEIVVGLSMVEWFSRGRRGRVQAQPRGIGSMVVLSVSEYINHRTP